MTVAILVWLLSQKTHIRLRWVCLSRLHLHFLSLSGVQVTTYFQKWHLIQANKSPWRSPIHPWAKMYLWPHTVTHTHTHILPSAHTQTVILQNVSRRAHPDRLGNMLICDFIGKKKYAVLHFHYWHHLEAPWGCKDRRTCVCVCVQTEICAIPQHKYSQFTAVLNIWRLICLTNWHGYILLYLLRHAAEHYVSVFVWWCRFVCNMEAGIG